MIRHATSCDRMVKYEGVGMQTETIGGGAVEVVSNDGAGKSVGVSAMNAELMGSAGLRPQMNVDAVDHSIAGDGAFAVLLTHHLPWTIVGVGTDG